MPLKWGRGRGDGDVGTGTGLICCVSWEGKNEDVRSIFTFESGVIDFTKTDMLILVSRLSACSVTRCPKYGRC